MRCFYCSLDFSWSHEPKFAKNKVSLVMSEGTKRFYVDTMFCFKQPALFIVMLVRDFFNLFL